jgi:ActR/RegA family two-component response regulator
MISAIVVEDDVEFAEKVAARLLRRGWDVDCCASAATALAHLIRKKYQYAFVDLMLPPSSDGGIQVLRDFLRLQRESTAFLMTGITTSAVSPMDKAMTLGARRFFDKNRPDMLEDLMNAVEAAEIEKRRGIFISHGHEELIKFKLKDFFERRIGRRTVVLSE